MVTSTAIENDVDPAESLKSKLMFYKQNSCLHTYQTDLWIPI